MTTLLFTCLSAHLSVHPPIFNRSVCEPVCSPVCLSEIVERLKKPPPLCRPLVSVDEAPTECLSLMNECWNEDPSKRPSFDDIFKQVRRCCWTTHCTVSFILRHRLSIQCCLFVFAVPGYQQRQAGKHHRLHAANVGAVQFQPGGSDQRANR